MQLLECRALLKDQDTLAEWLRRRPAKPMGSPRVGSNPTGVACLISLSIFSYHLDFSSSISLSIPFWPPPLSLSFFLSFFQFLSLHLTSGALSPRPPLSLSPAALPWGQQGQSLATPRRSTRSPARSIATWAKPFGPVAKVSACQADGVSSHGLECRRCRRSPVLLGSGREL